MGKTLRERLADEKWLLEQVAHAAIGLVVGLAAADLADVWLRAPVAGGIGVAAGSLAGGVRELVQNVGDADNDYLDMGIDLGAFIFGALLSGVSYWTPG